MGEPDEHFKVTYFHLSVLSAVTKLTVHHSLCIVTPGKCLQRAVLSTIGPLAPFNTVLWKPLKGNTREKVTHHLILRAEDALQAETPSI